MNTLGKSFLAIVDKIEHAARISGRSGDSVQLVAVSKGQSVEAMQQLIELHRSLPHRLIFGENYVQEFRRKKELLRGSYETHMIGALQRNKSKDAVVLFDLIQSVHSTALLEALNKSAQSKEKVQEVFLQVNISNDPSKSGFQASEVPLVIEQLGEYPSLHFNGLMTITKLYEDPAQARPEFRAMRSLHERLCAQLNRRLELSMGMSADFDVAIEEGATIVRVGSALFGERL